jgi:hypothetical protein
MAAIVLVHGIDQQQESADSLESRYHVADGLDPIHFLTTKPELRLLRRRLS